MAEPSRAGDRAAAPGRQLVRLSWVATFALAVSAAGAIASSSLRVPVLVLHAAMFVAGCVLFLWAYAVAIRRSRLVQVDVVGVYFLAGGSAPPAVRRQLLGSLGAQVVISIAAAAARPFTSLAAAILVPVVGLGLTGLWGARHGTFPPRPPAASRPQKRAR